MRTFNPDKIYLMTVVRKNNKTREWKIYNEFNDLIKNHHNFDPDVKILIFNKLTIDIGPKTGNFGR